MGNSLIAYNNFFSKVRLILFWGLILILAACNNTKHLSDSEYLYTGAKVELQSDTEVPEKKELMSSLEEALYPDPNRKLLGLVRFRLWLYYLAGETEKEKGFRYWLKYKMGEPPVLLEDVNQENVSRLLRNRTFNRGHFKSMVSHEVKIKKKKASVHYTVQAETPYRIRDVHYPPDTTWLLGSIAWVKDKTLLKKGEIYELDLIERERQRIRDRLLRMGFYYFSPSNIYFQADTTVSGREVDLFLRVKSDIPEKAATRFRINEIYIYSNYSLEDTLSTSCPDTLLVDSMHYISRIDRFRPVEITNVIFLKKNEMYDREEHEKSISRLIGLDAFKFVNIRFEEAELTDTMGRLNMHVYLTPEKINTVRAELKGIAKSNNFAGPGLELTYINRNIFRGAEKLTVSTHGSWETQIGGDRENLNSYELGIDARLQYPRLETPFRITKNKQKFVPTTYIDMGYTFQHRVKYYTAHSLNTGFGYTWKNVLTSRQDLTLLSIEYYELGNTTDLFEEKLKTNPYLESTFQDQFMIGPRYSYTYNNQMLNDLKHHYYFQGRVDMSGLIVNGIMQGLDQVQGQDVETDRLFGNLYAQYFKTDGDVRYYQNLKGENRLVYRLFGGVGFPFGRSETLPYVKQYYAGGTNGIRAFRAREVGPGSFLPPDSASVFFEQTGDIKLEANVEYRFGIQGPLKGAFFMDAGNIWLMNETSDRPNSKFSFDTF